MVGLPGDTMNLVGWALLIGAGSYRIWRLIAEDAITEAPREGLLEMLPDWFTEMVTCPWCLGTWIAWGVTWLTDATIDLEAPILIGLASAVVVGILGERV